MGFTKSESLDRGAFFFSQFIKGIELKQHIMVVTLQSSKHHTPKVYKAACYPILTILYAC